MATSRTRAPVGGNSAQDVLDHDFPSDAVGRAIPFGIYDQGWNTGFVVVGTSHETSEFAIEALRTWWLNTGFWRYPNARKWLIEADCGGANGNRLWAWKVGLQRLANEFHVTITVSHYPPGASKWNRIEHRMFNLISKNWVGEPLVSYETVLNHICTTTSSTGFHCQAVLDHREYATKQKTTAVQVSMSCRNPTRYCPTGTTPFAQTRNDHVISLQLLRNPLVPLAKGKRGPMKSG